MRVCMCETIKNDQDEDEQFNELWATFHFLKITLKNYISLDTDTTSTGTGTDVSIRFDSKETTFQVDRQLDPPD